MSGARARCRVGGDTEASLDLHLSSTGPVDRLGAGEVVKSGDDDEC